MNPTLTHAAERRDVPLTSLVLAESGRLRCRHASLSEADAKVETFSDVMAEQGGWGTFPPLVAVELTAALTPRECVPLTPAYRHRKGDLILVGGYTRHAAGIAALVHAAPCDVYRGDWSLCLALAWKENSDRRTGTARKPGDLDQILSDIHALPEYVSLPTREVAEMAECSAMAVSKWRTRRAAPPPSPPPSEDDADPAPPSSPAPAPARGLADAWGRPVPACCAAAFAPVPAALSVAAKVRSQAKEVAVLKHGPDGTAEVPPGLADLDVAAVVQLAERLAGEVERTLPWLVCPWCGGWGCVSCGGKGWLVRDRTDDLPPDVEREARSHGQEQGKVGAA